MVVNNYYYSNPPSSYPKSTESVEVNNFVGADEVSNKEVISPEAKVQEVVAQETQNTKSEEKAAADVQTQIQEAVQTKEDVTNDSSDITGLGANLNVLV